MRKSLGVLAAMIAIGWSIVARAEPFDPAQVPADAAWVVQIDVDTLARTRTWDLMAANLQHFNGAKEHLADFEQIGGIQIPRDVHSVLIFSNDTQSNTPVIVIRSKAKRDHIIGELAKKPGYVMTAVDDRRVLHAWTQDGMTLIASFTGDDRMVISSSRDQLLHALDLAEGKAAAIATDAMPLRGLSALQNQPSPIAYAGCVSIPQVAAKAKRKPPMLDNLRGGWVAVSQRDNDLYFVGQAEADKWWTATAFKTLLGNAGSVVGVVVPQKDRQNNPDVDLAVKLLGVLRVESKDQFVNWTLPVAMSTIEEELRRRGMDVPAR